MDDDLMALVGRLDARAELLADYAQSEDADLDRAAARTIKALAEERDRLSRDFDRMADLAGSEALRADAAEARCARLEEALKPFAEAAADLDESDQDQWDIWEHHTAMSIKVADLRAARLALSESPVRGGGEEA